MSTELISQNGRRGRVSNGDGLIRFTLCPLDLNFAPKNSGTSKFSMHIYIYESHLRLTFLLIKEASKPEAQVEGFGVGSVGGKFGEELRKNAKEHTIQDEVHASLVSSADGIGGKEGEVGISQMDGVAEKVNAAPQHRYSWRYVITHGATSVIRKIQLNIYSGHSDERKESWS